MANAFAANPGSMSSFTPMSRSRVGMPMSARSLSMYSIAVSAIASAPGGLLICLEDLLGWWPDHPQPVALDAILALAAHDPEQALEEALRGRVPYGCDGRVALQAAGAEVIDRALWRWPFSAGTDYLVCATVARTG